MFVEVFLETCITDSAAVPTGGEEDLACLLAADFSDEG